MRLFCFVEFTSDVSLVFSSVSPTLLRCLCSLLHFLETNSNIYNIYNKKEIMNLSCVWNKWRSMIQRLCERCRHTKCIETLIFIWYFSLVRSWFCKTANWFERAHPLNAFGWDAMTIFPGCALIRTIQAKIYWRRQPNTF